MSHQFGDAFIFVRSFFAETFPYREHGVYYSLYCVEIACCFWKPAFYLVLLKIDIEPPNACFLLTNDCAQSDPGPECLWAGCLHTAFFLKMSHLSTF